MISYERESRLEPGPGNQYDIQHEYSIRIPKLQATAHHRTRAPSFDSAKVLFKKNFFFLGTERGHRNMTDLSRVRIIPLSQWHSTFHILAS